MFLLRLIDDLQTALEIDINELVTESQVGELKENSLLFVLRDYTTQYTKETGVARFEISFILVGCNFELGYIECRFLEKWADKNYCRLTLTGSNAYRENKSKLMNETVIKGVITVPFNQPREPLETLEININE